MRHVARKPPHRRLKIEVLEERCVMDGNVTAGLHRGLLVISGDALSNQVEISQPTLGSIRVEGLEGTTVNGQPFKEVSGLVLTVALRLRQGGEDQIAIFGPVRIVGNLRAAMGDGDITIEGSAGPVNIGRNLIVRGGENASLTLINEVFVRGQTNIEVGGSVVATSGQATIPDFTAASFSDSLNIDNPYFPLVQGATWTYDSEGIDEDTGQRFSETIVVEVLPGTRTILGVQVRTVRDRVFRDGLLIEDTFDWYAQDDNGNVWYLGEDVTDFEYDDAGNLIGTSHPGAWEAGVADAVPGTIMPADPRVGDIYYQEFQPGGVLDQAEVLSREETLTVPVGSFTHVLRTKDDSVRAPFELAHKVFAPGLGMIGEFKFDIEDDEILQTTRLVSVELNGAAVTQLVSPGGFAGTSATGQAKRPIKFRDDVTIRAGGPVLLDGAQVTDDARINSRAEVLVLDSVFGDTAWIRAQEAVTFRNVSAEEEVKIRGDVDVHLFDSILDELQTLLGAGDNRLVVKGLRCEEFSADGGRGDNTFEDLGGSTFDELRLRRLN